MSDTAKGIWAMIAACVIWGLSPLYYKALSFVPPLEVLSHRTIWSLVIFGLVLVVQGRLGQLRAALSHPRSLAVVVLAAVTISVNWGVFIWSIQFEHAVEASLGYYIFPLVSVLLGALVMGERLRRMQWIAVSVVACAVLFLTWGLGVPPWISLILASSFGLYGLIKKRLELGPVVSVTGEVAVLAPLALIWLWGVHVQGWQGVTGRNVAAFGSGLYATGLLVVAGAMTAGPLILFSYASKRLTMATVGLMQYLNPTLQFMCATLVFAEPFSRWHAITFVMIWGALAAYSLESLAQERASRRAARRSATVS
ncbi:MAG: EamA family transporter RarD [Brevirhabdus sp.]